MAGKRSKLLLIVLLAAGVSGLGCLSLCCLTGWLGGEAREENEAAISAARVRCRQPMVFRLRQGGISTRSNDWDCISAEQAQAERSASAVAVVQPTDGGSPAAEDDLPSPDLGAKPPTEVPGEAPSNYWGQPSLVWINHRRCPDALWSIVPNFVPTSDEFERHDLEARRASLREQATDATYAVTLRGRLGEYDFDHHRFPLEVDGTTGCAPSIRIALGRPSVNAQTIPNRLGGPPLHHRSWQATAVEFFVPIEDEAAARDLQQRTSGFLGRRIDVDLAFRVKRGRNEVRMGRGLEADRQDIGAGPLITTEVVARRVRIGDELLLEELPE